MNYEVSPVFIILVAIVVIGYFVIAGLRKR